MKKKEINWRLIVKVAEEKASKSEKKEFDLWLNKDHENIAIFEEIRDIIAKNISLDTFDSHRAFYHFVEKNHLNDAFKIAKAGIILPMFIRRTLVAAASITILFILGKIIYTGNGKTGNSFYAGNNWKMVKTAYGQRLTISLGDGSFIRLYPGSSLHYPDKFEGKERIVKLEGEAFFDIAKDSSRPFIVESGDIRTKVLGTSFKIESFKQDSLASVSVVTGKVAVSYYSENYKESLLVLLTPNKRLIYNKLSHEQNIDMTTSQDSEAIGLGKLEFRNITFKEVAGKIERYYNVKVNIMDSATSKMHITATFDYIPLTQFIEVLKELPGIQISQKGQNINIAMKQRSGK